MPDWVSPLLGVVLGALILLVGNWIRDRKETKEKYKLSLYAKRLQVHQEAFDHIRKLRRLSHLNQVEPGVEDTIKNTSSWWDFNCLYLDDTSRERLDLAILRAYEYLGILEDEVYDEDRRRTREAFKAQLDGTQQAIIVGIGMKHLDVQHDAKQVVSEKG